MVAISELLQSCLAQFLSLINSGALSDHIEEVPLQEWTDELGRLRVWAANIGAHQTRQSSLDYRLRDASHIKSQIVRLLEQFQELLTDLKDVLEEESDDEAEDDKSEGLGDSDSENATEIQEIHQVLVETINQLYQMSMIIRKPAQHDRLVGTKRLDSEPFQFWAKQHAANKYPNADPLAIDRISSAMARQRAILKYRERHHAKLSQGIDSESDSKSAILSETVVTDAFKEIPGQFSDRASDAGVSETSYGGTLLEGTNADAPKIPPIPKNGMEQRPFECPYCFYIITVRDRRAWARHIFRDLMPYVCIFPGCSTPNKLYGGRRQWHHHIQQAHATTPSTDGTYHCPICKQGSLPAVTFQRHVGQHLEELALFLLPRTDSGSGEDGVTDENVSNVSFEGNSMEQSVGQRNNLDNTATPASNSNLSDNNPLRGPRSKRKDSISSVGVSLSDRESPGDLESNVEDKIRDSSSPYNRESELAINQKLFSWSPAYNREYELAMNQKLQEKSDVRQNMDLWEHQQEIERLQPGLEKSSGRSDNESEQIVVNPQPEPRESRLPREDLEYEENAAERLRKLELFERKYQSAEVDEKWKELARMKEEAEEREKLEIRDEDSRTAKEKKEKKKEKKKEEEEEEEEEELAMKAAAEEWKLEQERIKQRQAQEFRDHLRSLGHSDEEIDTIVNGKKEDEKKEEKKEEKKVIWIKVHRKHLVPATLIAFNLPWDWDEYDEDYIIIKQWVDDDLQEELFAHTRRVREGRLDSHISSPTTELKVNDRFKDEMYPSRAEEEDPAVKGNSKEP
ncbi:hypothetical protein N7519_008618 [Penicillium mononematosum]|uniref:uncharacterized protein n=1 Tax=Penicillium mononematosum TaxID=268346 RepID=UPI0025493ACC|nr:uncharacterized protein N7519_008618 [Penicillium mononematosum]KAJ6178157.1 hypothetical protein N7519_008618 [Penicillium mononematosum]